jgi:hypothetical protein
MDEQILVFINFYAEMDLLGEKSKAVKGQLEANNFTKSTGP